MKRTLILIAFVLATLSSSRAQWEMQDSHSTASFRGVHAVDGSVAWASGTSGTVLRTVDGGSHWTQCAVPSGAENLDFRAVWAWDANNAMVMSIGSGESSRIYMTTDGCQHWTEEKRNREKEGFWDGLVFQSREFGARGDRRNGVLIGDPVRGHLYVEVMVGGSDWVIDGPPCPAREGEGAFAASNSSVFVFGPRRYILGTGGKSGPRLLLSPLLVHRNASQGCVEASVPLASGTDSAGVFSIAFRDRKHGIAVGGDYRKTEDPAGSAAWTSDGGRHWTAAAKLPHGFRSAVAWHVDAKVWISAGPNGSDFSRDGGKTWQSLDHGNWNALSLPFAVGPKGRIGRLDLKTVR